MIFITALKPFLYFIIFGVVLILVALIIIEIKKYRKLSPESSNDPYAPNFDEFDDLKLSPDESSVEELPYKKKQYLLTKTENKFYYVLSLVIGDKYLIHPKVGLKDLVSIEKDSQYKHWSKIAQKHIDFVICDKHSLKPVCAIELDDYTHKWNSSQKRDSDKNNILAAAGLPLYRFKVSSFYNQDDIRSQLLESLQSL
jgi:hypothetical protein